MTNTAKMTDKGMETGASDYIKVQKKKKQRCGKGKRRNRHFFLNVEGCMCEIHPEGDFPSTTSAVFPDLVRREVKSRLDLSSCHVSPTLWERSGLIRALENPCKGRDWDVLFGVHRLV